MFNKSHSVAYAVLCLQTAYLKAHYPSYFYKALLNMVKDDNGKINKFIVDAQNFGVKVKCPNINLSQGGFSIANNEILFGLEAISGIGKTLSNVILEERNRNGKFLNMNDFINRIHPSDSQIIALIKSGAIPTKDKRNCIINYGRKTFKETEYKDVKSLPTKKKLKEEYKIDSDIIKDKEERLLLYNNKRRKEFENNKQQKFKDHMSLFCDKYLKDESMWEFETLSIFLSDNPFVKAYENIKKFEDIDNGENCVIVGVVSNIVKKKDKNKNQFAYITLYSAFGIIEVTCWSNQFRIYQDIIKKNNKISILCEKKDDKAFVCKIKVYEQWLNDINKNIN